MKQKEETPDVYKIVYRPGRWKTKCTRYHSGFSAQQAFDCFYHNFMHGHVQSNIAKIFKIYRFDRFADLWYNETIFVVNLPDGIQKDTKGHITLTR